MKFKLLLLLIICKTVLATGQVSVYNDPNFPKPASGYGSDGTHTVGIDSFINPAFPSQYIRVYHPSDITAKVPTIFYSHAFGGFDPKGVDGMLYFVAKKGYAIVFVPYQTAGVTVENRYANLLNGFQLAARKDTSVIDTTKVGFLGWSFGGGATYANAYTCFTTFNWGSNGRFMYTLAPWYTYNISQSQLLAFPANTKFITEVFDDDSTNDHRMAMDIFNTIGIPDSSRDFLLLRPDTIGGYIYVANHSVPNTSGGSSQFNAFDYYGYYRLLDALCDYTFNGNPAGKNMALGHGNAAQVTMPAGLKNLVEYTSPAPVYQQNKYEYPCSDTMNPRSAYCPEIITTGISTVSPAPTPELTIYPNPATSAITVKIPANTSVPDLAVYNTIGQLIFSEKFFTLSVISIDLTDFPKGLYVLTAGGRSYKFVRE
ncbi:T9SS type A sorting domain-containing protein [Chitinophagaceae bacterium MMS25-I14]